MKSFVQRSIAPLSLALVIMVALVAMVVITAYVELPKVSFAKLADPVHWMNVMSGGKSVNVVIYDGTNRVDRHVPAINGTSIGYSGGYGSSSALGQDAHLQITENYKVIADPPGNFQVIMHRVVDRNGVKTISDITMPVWKSEPPVDQRIKMPDGSAVVAYLSGDSSH